MIPTLNWKKLQKILINSNYYRHICSKNVGTKSHETAMFIGKQEEPVLVVAEEDDIDLIGPPNQISNLRPIIRKRFLNETKLQKKLKEMQDATQEWNQNFWAAHNTNFINERQKYIDEHQVVGEEKKQLTADEMSDFYKAFLDKNWENHVKYNFEWYQKNFILLFLAFRVGLEKYFR